MIDKNDKMDINGGKNKISQTVRSQLLENGTFITSYLYQSVYGSIMINNLCIISYNNYSNFDTKLPFFLSKSGE